MRNKPSNGLHIVWIYAASLEKVMDAATWLETVRELRNLGWQVTLIAVGPAGRKNIRGVEVLCLPRPEIYFLRQVVFHLRSIYFIVRKLNTIDIILFHDLSAPWILQLRHLRHLIRKRKPLLVMDTRSLPMPQLDKGTWRDKIRKITYGFTSQLGTRYVDGRLAITQRMANAVQIPPEKLWGTWHSGADVEHFSRARASRRWPSQADRIRLIYHGSMHYERNLMSLCRAVVRVNANGILFELSLIGDGTERGELEAFASQTGGAISVVPPIKYEDIPEVLAQAHVGVLPFPDEEKFRVSSPIKLFEYLAAGLPILATHIVCHTDVVGSGEYAIWADDASEQGLFDALRLVLQSRHQLSDMGQRAAVAAEAWTWKSSAAKLSKALETGLNKSIFDSD